MGKKKLKLKREYFDGGGIAGLLGSAGGLGGTGFTANSGTSAQQINQAYNQNQAALTDQGTLATTLAPQAATAVGSQNVIAGQLANEANGNGPNVATNVLNQATGANVANQAALMAGQRGAGSNVGLFERQNAQQGANTQQQAAGQAATTQAEQQIAAQTAGANLANTQIGQAQTATTADTQAEQGEQATLQGANTANNQIEGNLANTTLTGQQGVIGGVVNGIGGALGLAKGGEVGTEKLDFVHKMTKMGLEHHAKAPAMMADGGTTPSPTPSSPSHFGTSSASASDSPPQIDPAKAQSAQDSMRGAFGYAEGGVTDKASMHPRFQGKSQNIFENYFAEGGAVPAMVSPGEVYLSPDKVQKVLSEDVDPVKIGEKFKGKAKVKGDSLKNDVIPKTLEQGGVVIDREHMQSADKRKLFVHKAIAKKKAGVR